MGSDFTYDRLFAAQAADRAASRAAAATEQQPVVVQAAAPAAAQPANASAELTAKASVYQALVDGSCLRGPHWYCKN